VPQPAQKLGWIECVEWIEAHVRAGAVVLRAMRPDRVVMACTANSPSWA
jgi:hypothetical protein